MAREIVPNINRISAARRAAGGHVVYLLNTIDANAKTTWSNWFQRMSGDKRADRKDEAFADGSYGHLRWPGLDVRRLTSK